MSKYTFFIIQWLKKQLDDNNIEEIAYTEPVLTGIKFINFLHF